MSQRIFMSGEKDGLKTLPDNMTFKDWKLLSEKWSKIDVICPWCLFYGKLFKFVVRILIPKRGHKISLSSVQCPDCKVAMRKRTILKTTGMNIEDYAYWFWDNVFCWHSYNKVSWEKLKKRLYHFTEEDRDTFWNVYHEFKESPNKRDVMSNRLDYINYITRPMGLKNELL